MVLAPCSTSKARCIDGCLLENVFGVLVAKVWRQACRLRTVAASLWEAWVTPSKHVRCVAHRAMATAVTCLLSLPKACSLRRAAGEHFRSWVFAETAVSECRKGNLRLTLRKHSRAGSRLYTADLSAIAAFPHQSSSSFFDSYFTVDLRIFALLDLSNPSTTVRCALAVWPAPSIVLSILKAATLFVPLLRFLPVIGRDMWMLFACLDLRRNVRG